MNFPYLCKSWEVKQWKVVIITVLGISDHRSNSIYIVLLTGYRKYQYKYTTPKRIGIYTFKEFVNDNYFWQVIFSKMKGGSKI